MFYKALGYAVWTMAMKYLRLRFDRYRKPALALTAAAAIAVVYVATRSDEE